MTQYERAQLLKRLHVKGAPLILFNIWDAGSAKVLQESGAKVIATSSWSVAAAHGYGDGEQLAFDVALANLKRIIARVDLPVTFDFEGGYGPGLIENVLKVIEAGAVGINFEDQVVGGEGLYSIDDQCKRIQAICKAAHSVGVPIFINARTDIFFKYESTEQTLNQVVERAHAYAASGATGLFVPGLKDLKYIERLCALSPLPINVMMLPEMSDTKQLAKVGVARISYGPGPYCQAMDHLKKAAMRVF